MSHIVDFFKEHFGAGGSIVTSVIFAVFVILGIIIAFRGRKAMVWIVSACALLTGILAGAMTGLLVFDSFIIMIVLAVLGGTLLLLLVKYVRGVGYFIGIGTLTFFLSYIVTSEMYMTNTRVAESTLLLFDLTAAVIVGILSIIKSKYIISLVTAASGGIMTSVSTLAIFGRYFADWRMWLLALAVFVGGMIVQIRTYDIKLAPKTQHKPERNKHVKK